MHGCEPFLKRILSLIDPVDSVVFISETKDYIQADWDRDLLKKRKDADVSCKLFLKPEAVPFMETSEPGKLADCGTQTSPPEIKHDLTVIKDFDDLLTKSNFIQLPEGFHKFTKSETLHIALFEENVPKIKNTLIIKKDLSYELWDGTILLSNEKVSDIVKDISLVTCVLDIENILLYLSISSECDTEENMVEKCINILEAQDYTEESDARLILFIVEQLKLLYKGNSHRRYSKQLLETCIRWEKRNTAFYRMLIEDDYFILPRTSYLKRIGNVNSGTDETPDSPPSVEECKMGSQRISLRVKIYD
ncbi:unnamed protein product [Lepeophtheirus salmonis]|uniref:(salmon louse) hypothetical protein n=1 Tax=Lepeophtheirus salmonis TaxID=72036 RepID=A0A7R8CLL8_LEPSM|nr:unnamed protein product [Lepeophtheirus salmonis]CAF2813377.1 unnamed protein product [Lepeophtheirus salmonis]